MANVFDLLGWLNTFTKSPAFSWGAAGVSGAKQDQAQTQADIANEARYGQGLQVLNDALRGGLQTYDTGNLDALRTLQSLQNVIPGAYAGQYQNFMGGFNQAAGNTLGGYGDRYRFAENQLQDYGQQASADINRYFDEERGRTQQDLLNRGLLSSTEAANQFAGVAERRSAEQRRLAENLMQNRVNILGGYMGEQLGAQERYDMARAAYDAALSGQPIQAAERWGSALGDFYGSTAANRANLFTGGMGNIANWIGARNDVPPPPNQLPYNFGQNSVQGPQEQGFQASSLYGPAIGTAGAIGGAAALEGASGLAGLFGGLSAGGGGATLAAGKIFFFCVDATATVDTPDGDCRISDVEIGDEVLGSDGEYHVVVTKDCGKPHAARNGDYVTITQDDTELICTFDHVVDGKPAGEWPHTTADAVLSGDLALDGCDEYVVNGTFSVTSMIRRYQELTAETLATPMLAV